MYVVLFKNADSESVWNVLPPVFNSIADARVDANRLKKRGLKVVINRLDKEQIYV